MKTSKSIFSIFDNKSFLAVFSLVLAFGLWIAYSATTKSTQEQSFGNLSVSVQTENTYAQSQGLNIVSDITTQKFTVTVNGPSYIVSKLNSEDIILTATVENINSSGRYSLDVIPSFATTQTECDFVSVSPSKINVTFDYIDTQSFTVIPEIENFKVESGLIAQTPTLANSDKNTIVVTGPRSVVSNIVSVKAVAELSEVISESTTLDGDILLLDKNENPVYTFSAEGKIYNSSGDEVAEEAMFTSLSYNSVKITAPVAKKKTVELKATFENIPENVTEDCFVYTLSKSAVAVIGTPDNIDSLSFISLKPIDYTKLTQRNTVFQVEIDLPDGIKTVDDISTISVTVNYRKTSDNIKAVTDEQ